MSFLKKNWPWVVIPAGILLIAIVVLLATADSGSPFVYND